VQQQFNNHPALDEKVELHYYSGMLLTNYHSHFELDDGKGKLEDYVKAGLDKGFSILGFSPHAPLPYENDWTMADESLRIYLQLAEEIINNNNGPIELYRGLEIDFIPGKMEPAYPFYQCLGLDYCIGSVHSMEGPGEDEHTSFDGPTSEFEKLLEHRFRGDIRKMVTTYFELEIEILEKGGIDILGHCDLIKKRNKDNRFFDQDEPWYREEALRMLQCAAESGVVVEVNTGGLSRGATTEVYPSPWMLERCFELKIPLTLSADAHNPEHLGYYFSETAELLKTIGYREIYFFSKGEWQSQPI
jgi:histidinol-phosphatase (PHP family)